MTENTVDDSSDKTRRNLMVTSAGVIAVWALEIPLSGHLIGAVDLSDVDSWRAWTATAFVLFYFTLRYALSPATLQERREWLKVVTPERNKYVTDLVRKGFLNDFTDTWKIKFERALPPKGMVNPELKSISSTMGTVQAGADQFKAQEWSSTFVADWQGTRSLGRNSTTTAGRYRVTRRAQSVFIITRLPTYFTPSWPMLEYLFPYACALVAATIIGSRILIEMWNGWYPDPSILPIPSVIDWMTRIDT